VIGVRKRQCPSIAKNAHRLVERHTVFRQIARGFLTVPFKLEHAKHLAAITLALPGTQPAPRSGNLLLCVRVGRPVNP
jgi:hypothetical protein